jgi:hypothetical protein
MRIEDADVRRCADCREPFIVSDSERTFYVVRTGSEHHPKFCRDCRILRREQMAAATVTRLPPVEP